MPEDKKPEIKKLTEEQEAIKVAKIEIGKDQKAKITTTFDDDKDRNRKITFEFDVHIPTVQEELQITVRENEILGANVNNFLVNTAVRMIATLDIVTDQIKVTDDDNKTHVLDCGFWDMLQTMKQVGKAYKEIVFPVYQEFSKFQQDIEVDFDVLKKSLAHLGKK